jgi:hypothetical protein
MEQQRILTPIEQHWVVQVEHDHAARGPCFQRASAPTRRPMAVHVPDKLPNPSLSLLVCCTGFLEIAMPGSSRGRRPVVQPGDHSTSLCSEYREYDRIEIEKGRNQS